MASYNQPRHYVTTVVAPYLIETTQAMGYPRVAYSYYGNTSRQHTAQLSLMSMKQPHGIYKNYRHTMNGAQRSPYICNQKPNTPWTSNQHHERPLIETNIKFEEFSKIWGQGEKAAAGEKKEEPIETNLKEMQRINYEKLKKQLDDLGKLIDGNNTQGYQTADQPLYHGYKTAGIKYFEDSCDNNRKKRKLSPIENADKKIKIDNVSELNGWNTFKEDDWLAECKEDKKDFQVNNCLANMIKAKLCPVMEKNNPINKGWKIHKEEQFTKDHTDSKKITQNFNSLKSKFPKQTGKKSKTKVNKINKERGTSPKEIVDKTIHKVDLLDKESLRVKQPGLVSLLYSGVQCSGCDARFDPKDCLRYSQHLDWHFRQNRRDKEATRKAQRRPWFYSLDDWMDSAELQEKQETDPLNFFEQSRSKTKPVEESSAPAPPGHSYCALCGDQFQVFFHDDFEEWHCKNAVPKDGKIYHPECLEQISKVKKR